MYIAMNRFKIAIGREKDFERIWKKRETHLDDVPGFLEFHLVKGGTEETHTLYASHSTWESQTDFVAEGQDWFVANAKDGSVPDESQIRRKLTPIWRVLKQPQ